MGIRLRHDGQRETKCASLADLAADAHFSFVNILDNLPRQVEPQARTLRHALVLFDAIELLKQMFHRVWWYSYAGVRNQQRHRILVSLDARAYAHRSALG